MAIKNGLTFSLKGAAVRFFLGHTSSVLLHMFICFRFMQNSFPCMVTGWDEGGVVGGHIPSCHDDRRNACGPDSGLYRAGWLL